MLRHLAHEQDECGHPFSAATYRECIADIEAASAQRGRVQLLSARVEQVVSKLAKHANAAATTHGHDIPLVVDIREGCDELREVMRLIKAGE
jgi:hypothetical protein